MSSIFNVKPAGQSVFGGSTTNAFGQTTNTNVSFFSFPSTRPCANLGGFR